MPDMSDTTPPATDAEGAHTSNAVMPHVASGTSTKTPTPPDLPTRSLISDEQLREATGRTRKQWFRALDKVGAQDWDHKRIARWLGAKRDVDSWWAQSVTVDYEYARGKRTEGKRSDGSYEVGVSRVRASAWIVAGFG